MKEEILVSIITPIYNSEEYLQAFFKSIDNQQNKKFELILVNDGSIDDSDEICKKYMENHSNVKYFYRENQGVSSSRNFGISKAIGKYICFVDSDDLISKSYINDFVSEMENRTNDMIVCDYNKFYSKLELISNDDKTENNCTYKENDKYDILFSKYGGYLWNKIFLRDIIKKNNLKFDTSVSMCEDMLFVFNYLKYVNNVFCINNKNYYYRISQNSSSKKLSNIKWFTIFNIYDLIENNLDVCSEKFIKKYKYTYFIYVLEAKFRLNYIKKYEKYISLKEDNAKRLKCVKCKKYFSIYQNIKLILYKNFNNVFFKIKYRKELKI